MRERWTVANIPDQHGRVAVITGGNTGLGFEMGLVLASHRASVVFAVRDIDKGHAAAARMRTLVPGAHIAVQRLDLASLESVRAAADELKTTYSRIDLLINNAGLMYPPRLETREGFELQFGTNHLGHFALTGLLLDGLLPMSGSRVVTVSSVGHRMRARINFDDPQWSKSYGRVAAYGQSKLANLMFTYELQRRLSDLGKTIAVAAHPGAARSDLIRNSPTVLRAISVALGPLLYQSAAMGALPVLRAATDPSVVGGQYYGPSGFQELRGHPVRVESSKASRDESLQRRLWALSEELTGVKYPV